VNPPGDYSHYLLIDDLLALQRPLTPDAHDELLFIVVHQVYELWFKVVLAELVVARDELANGRVQAAGKPLRRVVAVERLLVEQLRVLETMGPEDFITFRDPLAPASGFQSAQFRAIERLSGGEPGGAGGGGGADPGGATLWQAFCACARRCGLGMPDEDEQREERLGSLTELYRDHLGSAERACLHGVAELLCDHDEELATWRHRHALMAAREIGNRPGTGGSLGVGYLQGTLGKRLYPDLWEVRNRL
jgi:tryptophan 2,3-dioxygenase